MIPDFAQIYTEDTHLSFDFQLIYTEITPTRQLLLHCIAPETYISPVWHCIV